MASTGGAAASGGELKPRDPSKAGQAPQRPGALDAGRPQGTSPRHTPRTLLQRRLTSPHPPAANNPG